MMLLLLSLDPYFLCFDKRCPRCLRRGHASHIGKMMSNLSFLYRSLPREIKGPSNKIIDNGFACFIRRLVFIPPLPQKNSKPTLYVLFPSLVFLLQLLFVLSLTSWFRFAFAFTTDQALNELVDGNECQDDDEHYHEILRHFQFVIPNGSDGIQEVLAEVRDIDSSICISGCYHDDVNPVGRSVVSEQ